MPPAGVDAFRARAGSAGRVDEGLALEEGRDAELLDVDAALEELARLDERRARVVELRFFSGLEMEECRHLPRSERMP